MGVGKVVVYASVAVSIIIFFTQRYHMTLNYLECSAQVTWTWLDFEYWPLVTTATWHDSIVC